MADCEMEISRTIWNHKRGNGIVVKPDGDGLGLIEIVQAETKNTIIISIEEARLISTALLSTADELESSHGTQLYRQAA